VKIGHVYIIHTTLARPPKDKITVCICADENLFFWINTKASVHGVGQFPLTAAEHAALDRDCYLDCSRVTTFQPYELKKAIHRGPISCELAQRIVGYLTDEPPKTLVPRYLKLAIKNLSEL
jgi:hypothetical protein